VDDDEAVRASLVLLATAQGWQTRAYASATEFLEASGKIEQPACLVLDLQMPDMNGACLRQKLVERGEDLPTLVLTAWPSGELAKRALMAGAREVISKPCDPMLWLQAVERALHSRMNTVNDT
jgi:FixJ family two-component response regulator